MTSLQFVLFVIPLILGSLCEARMENDIKIPPSIIEHQFDQQIQTLQDSLSHLQTHVTNLEKENSIKEQRFNQQIHTLQQKHENSLSHLHTHILNIEKENQLLQSKLKYSVQKLKEENEILKQDFQHEIQSLETRLATREYKFQQKTKKSLLDEVEDIFLTDQQNQTIKKHHSGQPEIDHNVPITHIPNDQDKSASNKKNHPAVQISNSQSIDNEKDKDENYSNKLNVLEMEIIELRKEDMSLKQQFREIIHQQIEKHNFEHLNTPMDQRSTFVTFTAYATEYRDYNADDVVLFDGIVSNFGEHYNQTNSIFTCPYSGYYLFSVHVVTDIGSEMSVDLRIDGQLIVSTYSRDVGYSNHGSLTTVQLCQQGASVWVRNRNNDDRMLGNSGRFSSFTGTLLRIG